jgi:poly(glycerol-phosphate) alpha-glucosyltransferase
LWHPIKPNFYKSFGPGNFRYSPNLHRAFVNCDADVAHLHALWMYTSVIIQAWSRRSGRPYLITANGMLQRWALNNAGLQKKIVGWLYERSSLKGAACIQVNSQKELEAVRNFGLKNPVCVIPNGVDVLSTTDPNLPAWSADIPPRCEVLFYLGRLHPKKNLEALLRAWHRAADNPSAKQWHLVIAGWDQLGHAAELRQLAEQLSIRRVLFPGPQFGDQKVTSFRAATAFVLPSLSEGLPMAVLEAWGAAKPVLMTTECNLPEGFSESAALPLGSGVEGIVAGLNQLFAMSEADREVMGQRGLALVQERFSWSGAARQLREVYDWMIHRGPEPACVVTS